MSAPRKGARQLARLAAELSERDLAVIGSVSELRLISARQIERLHFTVPGDHASPLSAARACRRTLERLVRERLLLRLERRIGGVRAGSASYVYAIGPVGERVAGLSGPRRRFREPSAMFVAHALAVSELYVRLHEVARVGDVKLMSVEAEPRCWRSVGGISGRVILKPDLFVNLTSDGYDYRWFVEVDLGTEHRPALIRKCRAFEGYYRSGVEQTEHGVFPRVLWVAPDIERAARIRSVIERTPGLTGALLIVTTAERAAEVLVGGEP